MRHIVAVFVSLALALQSAPIFAASANKAPGTTGAPRVGQVGTGTLRGTARSSAGQILANHKVQLRNVATGQLAGSTTSDAAGAFSFTGLSPANYVVEILDSAGRIAGTSAVTAVAAGATASIAVTAATAALTTAHGINTALLLTTIAAGAGITAIIVAKNKDEASPSR